MSRESDLAESIRLDKAGFMLAPGESFPAFLDRVKKIRTVQSDFETELAEKKELRLFDSVVLHPDERIPEQFVREAGDLTASLYAFRITHVPGFFLKKGVGLLWGGCMIGDTETGLSIFLIRAAFRNHRRWYFYDRRELFAHELCHAMRQSLDDSRFEEHFAYQTSPSALRRYLGNCFIREYDAILFVAGTFVLLIGQLLRTFWLPELVAWPFWLAAFAYPAYLLFRNRNARKLLKKARKTLIAAGFDNPDAVLFRASAAEIVALAAGSGPENFNDLRWQVIKARFGRSS